MHKKNNLKKNNIGILILSYRRLESLKKVIKKVKQHISQEDKIYIFADNINKKKNIKEQREVLRVIKYLKMIKDKNIKILFQKKNVGLKKNWELGYNFMFKKFKKVICLQDDDLIKKNFIDYMIYYLNKFENNKKIMNITGFATKIDLDQNYNFDSYFTKRSMSYSQASWRRVWRSYKKLDKNPLKIIKDKKKRKLLNSAGTDLLPLMTLEYFKLIDSIQIWWSWNIIRNKGLCLNPVTSLVENKGFLDGKATHVYNNKFLQNSYKGKKKIRLNKIFYDKKIDLLFQSNYNSSYLSFMVFNFLPLSFIKFLNQIKIKLFIKC